MARKWLVALLAPLALATALAAYHFWVIRRAAGHYRLLQEAATVEEKRRHFDEIGRYLHPWNPYCERAERWLREEGHEWEFLKPTAGVGKP